jgi:hypothetical protein
MDLIFNTVRFASAFQPVVHSLYCILLLFHLFWSRMLLHTHRRWLMQKRLAALARIVWVNFLLASDDIVDLL